MFDLSLIEMVAIAAVAIIVIGPKDLPMVMRSVGKLFRQMRALLDEIKAQAESLIAAEEEDDEESLKQTLEEMEADMDFVRGDDGTMYPAYDISDLLEEERKRRGGGETEQ